MKANWAFLVCMELPNLTGKRPEIVRPHPYVSDGDPAVRAGGLPPLPRTVVPECSLTADEVCGVVKISTLKSVAHRFRVKNAIAAPTSKMGCSCDLLLVMKFCSLCGDT